jgi:hypothetical protein
MVMDSSSGPSIPAPKTAKGSRMAYLIAGLCAVTLIVVLVALATIPYASSTTAFSTSDPCPANQIGTNCVESTSFSVAWNSQVTLTWTSSGSPVSVVCSGAGGIHSGSSEGGSGTLGFSSPGAGTANCVFDVFDFSTGMEPPVSGMVTVVSPIL